MLVKTKMFHMHSIYYLFLIALFPVSILPVKFRWKRTPKSSYFNDHCISNTDCVDNMYCPFGFCVCINGYILLPNTKMCVQVLNPGQGGCMYSIQCSAAWPGTFCSSQMCKCPEGTGVVLTEDGSVCVRQLGKDLAMCPLPVQYYGTALLDVLAEKSSRVQCIHGSLDPMNCALNRHFLDEISVNDLYDCIPHTPHSLAGVCCPKRALICIMPKISSADSTSPNANRYWYNSVTGKCEPFVWDQYGNLGNGNNFESLSHCLYYCGGTCRRGSPLTTSRVKESDQVTSYRTCSTDDDCRNNDHLLVSCQNNLCCSTRDFICGKFGGRMSDRQVSFPDAGLGDLTSTRFYWTGDRCSQFQYKGLAGNWNNFHTSEDCFEFCNAENEICERGKPPRKQSGAFHTCSINANCPKDFECNKFYCCRSKEFVCNLPNQVGNCSQSIHRYWFSKELETCTLFNYSGCNGNENNFYDFETCISFCSKL